MLSAGGGMDAQCAATGLTGMLGRRASEMWGLNDSAYLRVDLTDSEAVRRAIASHPADVVVNFAAYTDVGRAQSQYGDREGDCFRLNVSGAATLAQACAREGKFLVQISTDYVFEGESEEPYNEDSSPDATTDWYGMTKRIAEQKVQDSAALCAIVRVSFPFVLRSQRKLDVVRRIFSQIEDGRQIHAFTDQTITPTYADDAINAIAAIARGRHAGIFHGVGPEAMSPYVLATTISMQAGLGRDLIAPSLLRDYVVATGRFYPRSLPMSHRQTSETIDYAPASVATALSEANVASIRMGLRAS